jgi:DNA-binding NarL/FixJ family response regulator
MAIRIVLAEDDFIVREGVRGLLTAYDDVDVVAVCENLPALLAAVDASRPDVVVTDIRMPPTSTDEGIRAAQHLRRTMPDVGVVVLSQYADPEYAIALFEHGSERRAYLLKERLASSRELLDAVRAVEAGRSVVDPRVVEALVRRSRAADSPLATLTPREREVLSAMAEGQNNAAIAAGFHLSERAVQKHINGIFAKLGLGDEPGVHHRVRAVLLYLSDA